MLSTKTIDDIRELPIEQVIEKYIVLKKVNPHTLKACCPFHNEKTPSFTVNVTKNTFTCYGCSKYGDAIDFVMEQEHLPFIEACKRIASDNGITVEETEVKGKTEEQKNDEQQMLQLVRQANTMYVKILNQQI